MDRKNLILFINNTKLYRTGKLNPLSLHLQSQLYPIAIHWHHVVIFIKILFNITDFLIPHMLAFLWKWNLSQLTKNYVCRFSIKLSFSNRFPIPYVGYLHRVYILYSMKLIKIYVFRLDENTAGKVTFVNSEMDLCQFLIPDILPTDM